MAKPGLELTSHSLTHKWGFSDGDVIYYYLDRFGLDIDIGDEHRVLIRLVRDFLLPLIPECKVYELGTCHNPIRTDDENVKNVSVIVPYETVIKYINEDNNQHGRS